MDIQIEGMDTLIKKIRQLGSIPQKVVTPATRKGASIGLSEAKRQAPVLTGNLRSGLKLLGERSSKKGKKVYEITLNPAMNDIFVKVSKSGKRAYYPASQEYGFKAKNGRYIPGFHYLKNSAHAKAQEMEQTIIDSLITEIDKLTI